MHLGLIGYGSLGQALIRRMPSYVVSDLTVLQRRAAQEAVPGVSFVTELSGLTERRPDLIVECAGHQALRESLLDVLQAGISVIPASLGAFSDPEFLRAAQDEARTSGCELIFPSGAIGGLDILRALALAGDVAVTYRGIKPPQAWKGSPAEAHLDLDNLAERTVFFSGTGREAARGYPKNANVVAALALAGAGFHAIAVKLIADPKATGNTHAYEVVSPLCTYRMTIENAASARNARTSETTVLSILLEVQTFAQRHGRHK